MKLPNILDRSITSEADGTATEHFWLWIDSVQRALRSLSAGTVTPSSDGWAVVAPDGSGNVALDLANGRNLVLTLTAVSATLLAPTFTGAMINAGSWFNLWVEQDATGGRAAPTYPLGAGAFATDVDRNQVDGTPSVRTVQRWRYDGTLWTLEAFKMGIAIS